MRRERKVQHTPVLVNIYTFHPSYSRSFLASFSPCVCLRPFFFLPSFLAVFSVLGLNCEIEDEKESKTDFHEAIKLADALSGLVGKSLYRCFQLPRSP